MSRINILFKLILDNIQSKNYCTNLFPHMYTTHTHVNCYTHHIHTLLSLLQLTQSLTPYILTFNTPYANTHTHTHPHTHKNALPYLPHLPFTDTPQHTLFTYIHLFPLHSNSHTHTRIAGSTYIAPKCFVENIE